MKLLTKKLRDAIPRIDANGGQDDPLVHARFFTVWGLVFFVIEGEPRGKDFVFLAYGEGGGSDAEFECVMLSTFESMKGPLGLGIERDIRFSAPQRLSEVSASYRRQLQQAHVNDSTQTAGDALRDPSEITAEEDSASAQ